MGNIIHLRGIPEQLARQLVDERVRREEERAESLLREMRRLLGYAREVFPVNVELADAFGARAANKLAVAIGAPR